ncbi:hypothetical protein R6Z07M_002840 [Ovis aries]
MRKVEEGGNSSRTNRDLNQDESNTNKSEPSGTEQVQGNLRQDQSHLKLTRSFVLKFVCKLSGANAAWRPPQPLPPGLVHFPGPRNPRRQRVGKGATLAPAGGSGAPRSAGGRGLHAHGAGLARSPWAGCELLGRLAGKQKLVGSPRPRTPPPGSGLHPALIWETRASPRERRSGHRRRGRRSGVRGGKAATRRRRTDGRDGRRRPGCAPLFRAPTSASDPRELPEPLPAAQGRGSPGRRLRIDRRRAWARDAGTSRGRDGPAPHPLPRGLRPGRLPGSQAGREQEPGAPRPRARRGQGRPPGFEGTAARGAAPTLPPESGVEHSASPPRANEEDSHGNSTTYLRARNRRASLQASRTHARLAAPQTRQTARRGRALRLPGWPPRAPCVPGPGTLPGRRRLHTAPHTVGARGEGVCLCAPLCLHIFALNPSLSINIYYEKSAGIQRQGRLPRAGQKLIIHLGRGPTCTDISREIGLKAASMKLSVDNLRNFEEGSWSVPLVADVSEADFR